MINWTEEQKLAIDKDNTNIIVSAGAGSGKTAVLSERTLRKLKSGVHINNLLILTFTNQAAYEMKKRIREEIKEVPELKEELNNIDSSYITTFDSFSLSIVKRYSHILNMNRDINIVESSVINVEKERIIEDIFTRNYEEENPLFLKLIDTYTVKDDNDIMKLIIKLSNKLDLKYDKEIYLNNYISNYYNGESIENLIRDYEKLLISKIDIISKTIENCDSNFGEKLYDTLNSLLSSKDYDSIKNNLPEKIDSTPRNSDEINKINRKTISDQVNKLKELTIYDDRNTIKDLIEKTNDTVKIIINIILELDERINRFKKEINCFEFNDISKLAIKLVSEHEDVREELKNYFNEIMIDEYQDTSDLQELFISKLENNNVYMVGDIKQSIYRFRNANPYIFKNKYDNYKESNNGFKIDLTNNFRSRTEVITNINNIFDCIMDDNYGGADYKKEHQMEAKNPMYDVKENQDYNIEILNYNYDKNNEFNKSEIEIFTIIKDIKDKIDSGYKVLKNKELKNVTYSDFAILIDRSTDFELYKKIFMYFNIPIMVYQDTKITNENDLILINNIFKLVKNTYYKNYDKEFRRNIMSIERSFLIREEDKNIYNMFANNDIFNSKTYQKIKSIADNYLNLDARSLLMEVVNKFSFYEKNLSVGNNKEVHARINYLYKLMDSMSNIGYSIDDVIDNFNIMFENNYDIKCKLNEEQEDAVKLMTIHSSKGLEFPICYFSGYYKEFNIRDVHELFSFDNKYGIIVPFYDGITYNNISKELMKELYIKEEISEKIRLFYVALTRAKEKMIIINNYNEDDKEILLDNKFNYRSFKDIILSIKNKLKVYEKNINIDNLNLTNEYKKIKKSNYKEQITATDKIIYNEINIENSEIIKDTYSKKMDSLIDMNTYKITEEGKRFHYIFEIIDFKNPNYDMLNNFEKERVSKFLELDIFDNVNELNFYKEYEFIYEYDKIKRHGVIDLMVEDKDSIKIIDYKLKNIADENYIKQLNGYSDFIKNKFNKKTSIYLYSIIDNKLVNLDRKEV